MDTNKLTKLTNRVQDLQRIDKPNLLSNNKANNYINNSNNHADDNSNNKVIFDIQTCNSILNKIAAYESNLRNSQSSAVNASNQFKTRINIPNTKNINEISSKTVKFNNLDEDKNKLNDMNKISSTSTLESKYFVVDSEKECLAHTYYYETQEIDKKILEPSPDVTPESMSSNATNNTPDTPTKPILTGLNTAIAASNSNLSTNTITYKSKYFIPLTFFLFVFTLLPIQYHNENFGIQMRKMQDQCTDSYGYFNQNQTNILDTIFPYGFSAALSFENLHNELKVLDEIQSKQNLNNLTIKYLTHKECLINNYTNILNFITIPSTTTTTRPNYLLNGLFITSQRFNKVDPYHENDEKKSKFNKALNKRDILYNQIAQKSYHKVPNTNIILICDDEAFKKSLLNSAHEQDFLKYDLLDFQTNILTQWNISCKSLSNSVVTISYAQMTFLSGEIIGAIFFSMLADYIGRKRVYLATLYISTVVGSLISIVQSYKQFVIARFPIAALTQGCFIVSYVLLFEMILKSKNRHIYCALYFSSQFACNIVIAFMTKLIKDWRYLQLAGSLLSSIAIGYPWLIKESFKWLIVRDDFIKAEKVCKRIFKENGIIARFMKMKSDDQVNDDTETSNYWPMIIWQPTFRKIICYFVLMWSVISLTNFVINEEIIKLLNNHIHNYAVQNFILSLFNVAIGLCYLKFGKKFPLGSCMFLGGSFYLASCLISHNLHMEYLKTALHLISKILITCTTNILMLYVCELFPCEIRCSSFSFFLSIKHLSEMFAIYLFKVNVLSMNSIKIGLAISCLLLCICALLLPERSAFSFNLDYLEYLNRNHQFVLNSSTLKAKKNTCPFAENANQDSNDFKIIINVEDDDKKSKSINSSVTNSTVKVINHGIIVSDDKTIDDVDCSMVANTVIKKINVENHCKTGKLNPLYEEELVNVTSSSTSFNHTTPQTPRAVLTNNFRIGNSNDRVQYIQESSTKF